MSTPTPTGNGHGSNGNGNGNGHLDPSRLQIPDEATLARMLTDLYGSLGDDGIPQELPEAAPAADAVIPDLPSMPGLPSMPDLPGLSGLPGLPALSLDLLPAASRSAASQTQVPADDRPGGHSFYFIDDSLAGAVPAALGAASASMLDVEAIRRDFPILRERVHGQPLVWLDNAATTHKPQQVIDRLAYFYSRENSNVHRAAHALAGRATDAYEDARATVARFLGAASADGIVFTRGTTEAINLVAQAWGRTRFRPGDEILLSRLEHHANIVPWQQVADETGARLRVIEVLDDGQLDTDSFRAQLGDRTRLVAVAHVSNVLGTIAPVAQIIEAAHRAGARVLVDGAQAVAHMPVSVQALDADFYAFSGHKVFGPTGIGALYAKPEILADLPPWQGGGNMIKDVTFERTTYQATPAKFEAGTGNIADATGLAAALDYICQLGRPAIEAYEHQLLGYATAQLRTVRGLRLIGTAPDKAGTLTFTLDGYEPEQVGKTLDSRGIAVRAGHHCAQPILRRYGLEAAVRPSLALYNTCAEIDTLTAALHRLAADAPRGR